MYALYKGEVRTPLEGEDLMTLLQVMEDASDNDDAPYKPEGMSVSIYSPEDWHDLVSQMHAPIDEGDDVTQSFTDGEEWFKGTGMPDPLTEDQTVVSAGPSLDIFDTDEDFDDYYHLFDGDIDLEGVNDLLATAYPSYGYNARKE